MTPEGYKSKIRLDVFEDLEKSYSNFGGRQLTVTANNNHPFILFEKLSNGDLLPVAGYELAIIKALGEALNFTFRLVEPPDGKWGGPLPDGTVVGMIGVVARREAHFAMCEISVTAVREEVIDFTYPHYIESLTLISRAPMEKARTFAAFSPFTPLTWLLIAISLLLIGPIIRMESWLVNSYLPTKGNVISTTDATFNMFRSLVNQDSLFESENSPQKFTTLFWYLFGFIISALYSGMLTATLIKPSFEKPINGLEDLPAAVKNGFTLVTTADTSMEYMFKDAKSGIYADTWKLFNHKDRSKSFPRYSIDSFDQIVSGKLVIVNGQLSSRYHGAKRGLSQFYLARETFAPQYYGAPCFPGAPFLSVFNKMLSYMTEGGVITKFVENEFRKVATHRVVIQESQTRAFTIKHLQAAFYVLLIGFIIAAVALIVECITLLCL
ncbi:glutamate receptor ionotropic, delta-2-like [Macrobrachium rosenbergii]|uniref:glutamate receptor ionotropic, delta-2-like n=1 Tax=Macrobrachium rosenbergii TaxID=79674 RepID=UPI0034D5E5FE